MDLGEFFDGHARRRNRRSLRRRGRRDAVKALDLDGATPPVESERACVAARGIVVVLGLFRASLPGSTGRFRDLRGRRGWDARRDFTGGVGIGVRASHGVRGIVVARGLWRGAAAGRWLDGEVSGSVVRSRKWCAHASIAWVTAQRVERAPLVRSALAADSVVGVLIVVDGSWACGDVDEGLLLDLGCCWREGSRCRVFVKATRLKAFCRANDCLSGNARLEISHVKQES